MSDVIETVKVVTESGYKVINKSDLTEADKIYSEQVKPVSAKASKQK